MTPIDSITVAAPPRRPHGRGRLGFGRAPLGATLALAAMLGVHPAPVGAATASGPGAALGPGPETLIGCVVMAYLAGKPPSLYEAIVTCMRKMAEESGIVI
jgi:hypothetical protein